MFILSHSSCIDGALRRQVVHRLVVGRRFASPAVQVKSDPQFSIPIVNFSSYRFPTSESQKRATANELVTAFKEVGFVYLRDHGISKDIVHNTFLKSRQFFSLPPEFKDRLAWDDPRSNRGYVRQGRERVTQSTNAEEIALLRLKAPDAKETMEIGRDWNTIWNNKWPAEDQVPHFRSAMLDFFKACHELHMRVMSAIALGLELPENYFDHLVDQQYHNLRLLHYPSIPAEFLRDEGQARAGAHSDYGSLTFVFQDMVGGLKVQNPQSGEFHPASPIDGTVVVNVGDLLARWSNDVLRSTLHRVVSPSKQRYGPNDMTPARYSIAFFCNPNADARIEALPSCISASSPRKYEPIVTEEYIVGRLSDTYS